jgi:hypothetical protein
MRYEYFKNGFIGQEAPYSTEFYFSEEEERFNLELQHQPEDWVYRTKSIQYNLNSHGHRSIEIDELEDPYILFTGCSHTEGHGLAIEDTYACVVAQQLNMNYYNLALKGSGVDTLYHNLLLFLNKVKVKPKLIVVQWPEIARMALAYETHNVKRYDTYYPIKDHGYAYDYSVYEKLLMHQVPENQAAFYRQLVLQHLEILQIPTHQFFIGSRLAWHRLLTVNAYSTDFVFSNSAGAAKFLDYARDMDHAGIETNKFWADSIVKHIKEK